MLTKNVIAHSKIITANYLNKITNVFTMPYLLSLNFLTLLLALVLVLI